MNKTTKLITQTGVLAAISVVLVFFIHFPIFPAAPYLEYDPADIPILIGTLSLGPYTGLLITVVASLVQGLTVSAQSGVYGIIMHVIATSFLVLPTGLIYQRSKNTKGAVLGLAAGVIAMVVVMIFANLLVTPHFTGAPVSAIRALLPTVIIPFNLIKAGLNAVISFVIYKLICPYLNRK